VKQKDSPSWSAYHENSGPMISEVSRIHKKNERPADKGSLEAVLDSSFFPLLESSVKTGSRRGYGNAQDLWNSDGLR